MLRTACIALLLATASFSACAASIVVNTTDDVINSAADCSLREAIQAANSGTTVDACTGSAGQDTISFAASLGSASIALANTLPEINTSVTIDGGRDVTVVGSSSIDGFHFSSGTSIVRGLTIRNFSNSEGIDATPSDGAASSLTIEDSTLTRNNTAVGLIANPTTPGTGSVDLTIINSTLFDNGSVGVRASAYGGTTVNITLTNATVAFNDTNAFRISSSSSNFTFVANNSILTGRGSVVCYVGLGDSINFSGSANNISNDSDCAGSSINAGIYSRASINLGPLQLNGSGPSTLLPGQGSPAIDFVTSSCSVTEDARGKPRLIDGDGDGSAECDAGAVEVQNAAIPADLVVDTAQDSVNTAGDCSLREAIMAANEGSTVDGCTGTIGADTITFANAIGSATIVLTSPITAVSSDVTIDGGGDITIDGLDGSNVNGRGLFFASGTSTVTGLTVTGSNSTAIVAGSREVAAALDLTIANAIITGNQFGINAGRNNAGTVSVLIQDSTISDTDVYAVQAGGQSGAVTNLTIRNSTVTGSGYDNVRADASFGAHTHLVVENTTIANSARYGIYAGEAGSPTGTTTVAVTNSIIVAAGSSDCSFSTGSITGSNNLTDGASCSAIGATNSTNINLGPLQVNTTGTPTRMLLAGSAAIDFVPSGQCALTLDQRGLGRPVDGDGDATAECDAGSVEVQVDQYTVGGMLTGLAVGNSVTLQNNAGDDLVLNTDGSFTFATALNDGSAYAVTVSTQPSAPNQTCTVSNGSGTLAGANINNVQVTCTTTTYTVGGTLSGAGNSVTLQNNAGDNLVLNANGSFTFATALTDGSAYAVTVLTQPSSPNQTCTVTNGSGTLAGANVTNVQVTCTTTTYTVGGTLTGLASGNSVTLQNNAGDNLVLNTDGSFTFATALNDGSAYAVTVLTQPSSPNQTCTVTNGSGTLAGAKVNNVQVSCVTATYTVGGTLTGLAGGNSVTLQNNGGDDLVLSADGNFIFPTQADGSVYAVSVLTQPSSPNQTCTVTNTSGTLAGANVTNVQVSCVTTTYTVGGTLTGLAGGNSVTLQNNAGDNLVLNADGSFTFATALGDGSAYAVTVLTQPSSPNQTCSVTNGSGTLAGANVTNVQVNCVTTTYTVGGTLSGLASANSVTLQNNAGDDLVVNADGSFAFATALVDGSAYAVTVLTQPSSPNQTCTVTNASGTLAGANVTNVQVSCVTTTYTVGGTLSGLAGGNSVTLQNNAGDDLVVNADGSFTFATAQADGSAYTVTVSTQPSSPNQTCTVTNASGTLAGANVTNVQVSCVTSTYTVGGTLSGLASANSVTLQNNAGDDLVVNTDGSFTFPALTDGSVYAVTVLTQPSSPNQTCSVINGSGTLAGANVTNVQVSCVTTTYTVGGTLSGLALGNSVTLQNNAGDDLVLNTDGNFTFPAQADGSVYAVTVLTQPSTPNQTCTVSNGSGTLTGANVTNVQVACTTTTYTVGGMLTGLAGGNSLTLQNNAGDDLVVNTDGSFAFATALVDGSAYAVTVLTQPSSPNQICTVSNGSGTLAGANVTNVQVSCVTSTYTVGGTLSGLASANSLTLQNNAGDDLVVNADGSFAFATALADGSAYAVTVLTQPSSPNQTCTVTNASGTLAGANVTNVQVSCVTTTYTVGGTLSGLAGGNSVTLQNNAGDDLAINADGSFTFATALADGSAYAVTVSTQPSSPNQACTVTNASGTLAGANVTNVQVSCVTTTYTVGGTLTGLAGGNSVTLQNNGGDDLVLNTDGNFIFPAQADGSAYAVTVLTQPSSPNQTCSVTNGSGTLAGANVTNVQVSCAIGTYVVTGTVSGGHGSINPSSQAVNVGDTASFTITPDPGFGIDSVSGCNGSLNGNTYTTGPISGPCTVTAAFGMIVPVPTLDWGALLLLVIGLGGIGLVSWRKQVA